MSDVAVAMSDVLLIDGNYIGNLALHTKTGELDNGVVYGIIKQYLSYLKKYETVQVHWVFEGGGESLRRKIFPGYKLKRRKAREAKLDALELEDEFGGTPDETSSETSILGAVSKYNKLYAQLNLFRLLVTKHPEVFGECHSITGYEGDDIIAALCKWYNRNVTIIANDEDLFSLLSENVSIYMPSRKLEFTLEDFTAKYKVTPDKWQQVRAITGCSTDEIPGVPGVGVVNAVKYVNGYASDSITARIEAHKELIERNAQLVNFLGLTYQNVSAHVLEYNKVKTLLKPIAAELGMRSLA